MIAALQRHHPRLLGILLGAGLLAAMPSPAQRTDPMVQLMMSQPPMDFDAPLVATAVVDPPIVPVGELVVYRLTINALEASVRWPGEIPAPPGVEIRPSAGGQLLLMAGNLQKPVTARNFHLRATRPGFYTLPAFEIEAYGKRVVVPETRFEAVALKRPELNSARRLHLQLPRTNVFVGESVPVRVLAPGTASNVVSGLSQLQFNGAGIVGGKNPTRQLVEPREFDGRKISTFIFETTVTPIAAGELNLSAQGFTAGMFFSGPVVLQGQLTFQGLGEQNLLLDSEPVRLTVQPLPAIAESAGFTGFIGSLDVEPPQLSTNHLRVGDAVRMVVTFRGAPNVARLLPPPAPRVDGWQIYPPTPTEPKPHPPSTNAYSAFAFTMIPTTEDVKTTPAIPFHVFDPARGAYVDLTIPPQPLTVTVEGLATNWLSEMAALETGTKRAPRPQLNELVRNPGTTLATMQPLQSQPEFLALQLGPVAVLLGWWAWERRRRFLAAHPEIVRRRLARRALRQQRRHLTRALAARDATQFSRRAVAALQIAAAPHFPAESRALVSQDVLSLFGSEEQAGPTGTIIREFFAQYDATAFATTAGENEPLFHHAPELDRILKTMEARL